ncbi:TFIIA-alpha and beta-like factor isoform X2 [Dendrobates tinctorius]|uniref:TFIIA-alpha and beta-like factor isoform X2 n=1 Tax=Dendrobates tinctorius TaxID=92724 RepID=UPI003CCA13A9
MRTSLEILHRRRHTSALRTLGGACELSITAPGHVTRLPSRSSVGDWNGREEPLAAGQEVTAARNPAGSAGSQPWRTLPKLYKSIIEDVIEGVAELFAEEGIDEQVLKDLKHVRGRNDVAALNSHNAEILKTVTLRSLEHSSGQQRELWETKVIQSKATEGFFRDHSNIPQFVLQLPQHLHQSLHASTVLQGGRNLSHFTGTDMSSTGSSGSFTLPPGLTYPIHLPAGMTVQTASGQLYKVTVPVMVTQAPGAPRVLQQSVHQYFQNLAQPPRPTPSSQFGGNVQVGQNWPQQVPQVNRPYEAVNGGEAERPLDSNFGNANGETLIQQVVDMQNQQVASNVLNQPLNGLKQTNFNDMPPPLFSPKQTELTLADNAEALNNLNMAQTVQGQEDYSSLLKSPGIDVVDLLLLGDDEDKNNNIPLPNNNVNIPDKFSTVANQVAPNDNEIIQVDGTGDTSSDEELGTVRDIDENEFLGIIDTEDLKVLEDDSGSNDSTSNSSDDEDPEIDVIEEDPLNSGDDVSEQEVPDLFDTDNVIVCQYDKSKTYLTVIKRHARLQCNVNRVLHENCFLHYPQKQK